MQVPSKSVITHLIKCTSPLQNCGINVCNLGVPPRTWTE